MVNDHGQSWSTILSRNLRVVRWPFRIDRMRTARSACILAGYFFLGTMLAFSQATTDPWLILATGAKGVINIHTTREQLVRLYGASNVVDQDADVGEGEIEPETVLFPKDPKRRIGIFWKNPDKRAEPASASIRGTASRWHAVHGISLGTTLTDLQRANGRPFRFDLVGDGTDMAHNEISWHGGSLEQDFHGEGTVTLKLVGTPTHATTPKGPRDFGGESDSPEMHNLNLYIDEMTWVFPPQAKP